MVSPRVPKSENFNSTIFGVRLSLCEDQKHWNVKSMSERTSLSCTCPHISLPLFIIRSALKWIVLRIHMHWESVKHLKLNFWKIRNRELKVIVTQKYPEKLDLYLLRLTLGRADNFQKICLT